MSTLKVNSIANNGSAVDFPNGAFNIGGSSILQGYTSSATEPASPSTGDFWWDSANEELYQYLNGEFKAIVIVSSAWTVDLSNVTYDSVSFSLNSQDPGPFDVVFNTDGTKMYMIGQSYDKIYQYSLSTALDLSTASYDNVSFSIFSQESTPTSVVFNDDGTKMYITGEISDKVHQYSLSTGFDLSTASYDNVFFSWSAGSFAKSLCLRFNPSGTKMFLISEESTRPIYQYTLSSAFDVSTASYDNVSFALSSQDTGAQSIYFDTDGTKMYMAGTTTNTVYQYSLSTGFDLSTASYDSVSVATSQSVVVSLTFSLDGTKMYATGLSPTSVGQYSTGL